MQEGLGRCKMRNCKQNASFCWRVSKRYPELYPMTIEKKNKSPTIMTTNIFGRCHSCLVQRRRAQRFKMSSFNLSPGTKVLLASDQLSWVGGEQLRTMSRLVKNWFQFDIAKVVNFNKYSSIYWSFRAPFCFVSPSVFFHLRRLGPFTYCVTDTIWAG